ncbi:MAG: pirin family protein [Synergistaceae bacterium]|jgi:redox-sensitive bicupin YhaK (pirin superfamily)|nr:pirin family protein [Synergistaceae bacterium]
MQRHIESKKMGHGKHAWLDSTHHFSFADYYNPDNIQFGVLRVLNDDIVAPGTGFGTHPHRDMEIISYVINGELTHEDSMKNKRTLSRGQVQYMSAGTGVTHSEYNLGGETLRFLQIWIFPDKKGCAPNYGDHKFAWADRENKWLLLADGKQDSGAPIHVHADIGAYAAELSKGGEIALKVAGGRQAYLVLIEGAAEIGKFSLSAKDAMEIIEEDVTIKAAETSHILVIQMEKTK